MIWTVKATCFPIKFNPKNDCKFHIDFLVIENQYRKNDLQQHFVACERLQTDLLVEIITPRGSFIIAGDVYSI